LGGAPVVVLDVDNTSRGLALARGETFFDEGGASVIGESPEESGGKEDSYLGGGGGIAKLSGFTTIRRNANQNTFGNNFPGVETGKGPGRGGDPSKV